VSCVVVPVSRIGCRTFSGPFGSPPRSSPGILAWDLVLFPRSYRLSCFVCSGGGPRRRKVFELPWKKNLNYGDHCVYHGRSRSAHGGFPLLWPRLAKSNVIKVYCRPQPQMVHVLPVHVFRIQLGGPGHRLRHRRVHEGTGICDFLWSGMATCALTIGYPLIFCLSRGCPCFLRSLLLYRWPNSVISAVWTYSISFGDFQDRSWQRWCSS
jgi:hypothetical protein